MFAKRYQCSIESLLLGEKFVNQMRKRYVAHGPPLGNLPCSSVVVAVAAVLLPCFEDFRSIEDGVFGPDRGQ